MKMEQVECSETSAYIIQTPGNYPKENKIQKLFLGQNGKVEPKTGDAVSLV